LVAGPAGSGKTTLAAQFIVEGLKRNEPGVIVAFEEYPQEYVNHTRGLGVDFTEMIQRDMLALINLRPLDLSVDETLYELGQAVSRIGAKRVIIDSLSGFEIALAPPYRDDFRESIYRMVGTLTGLGVTVMMTVESSEAFTDLRFSPHAVSFLTDDIILQRYIELDAQIHKVITVVKMRGGQHKVDLRLYETTSKGLVIGEVLHGYRGIVTGVPERSETSQPAYAGLTGEETAVLDVLKTQVEASASLLARQAGLPRAAVAHAIDRLVALNYAVRATVAGRSVYRPVKRGRQSSSKSKGS
jgi:circadian clock protein KaiC